MYLKKNLIPFRHTLPLSVHFVSTFMQQKSTNTKEENKNQSSSINYNYIYNNNDSTSSNKLKQTKSESIHASVWFEYLFVLNVLRKTQ